MTSRDEQVYVLDKDTVMRLWLNDKVEARVLTPVQAEALWRRYSTESRFAANHFAVVDDTALVIKLARDMRSPLGRVYFKTYGGKPHIVLKGHPGLRSILTGTRYGVQNAKVVTMGLGRAGVARSARGGAVLTAFLLTAWNIADYFLRDGATLGELIGLVATDVTKAAIGGGIGYMAGSMAAATVVGTFALGPLVVAVVVGIGVGLALDWIDNRFQLTQRLQAKVDEGIAKLEAEIEAGKQNLLEQGAQLVGSVVSSAVDLVWDATVESAKRELRRQFDRNSWRLVPTFR